jgi:hypothetical protein
MMSREMRQMTRNNEEHRIQSAIVEWFDMRYHHMRFLLFAIPNGGSRSVITGAMLKREGVRRGVPDLFLAIPTHSASGLFIEIKTPEGRVTPDQDEYHGILERAGYSVKIVRSFAQGVDVIVCHITGV